MGDDDDGHTGCIEFINGFVKELRVEFVNGGRGFVENQDLRMVEQCLGDKYALQLTTGEIVDVLIDDVENPEVIEDFQPMCLAFAHHATRREQLIDSDGKFIVEIFELLADIAEVWPVLEVHDILVIVEDHARFDKVESEHALDERCLPRTVFAFDDQIVAFCKRK